MFKRYLSLYYSSVNLPQSFFLFGSLLASAWRSPSKRRDLFSKAVKGTFADTYVFAFSSGRGALAACLQFAGIREGDEVLLSSFTCLAVPTAVLAAGANPVYVDIDPVTLNTTPGTVLNVITDKTKAVVIQHTFGCAASLDTLITTLQEKKILVIEDCALALGSQYEGKPLGSSADAAIFSLELSKTLSTGWGGILAIRKKELAQAASAGYDAITAQTGKTVFTESLQTAISAICHHPSFYWMGKYIVYIFFRIGFFRYSTPQNEVDGEPAPSFISKLSGTQASLASLQWKRLDKISRHCDKNAGLLRTALQNAGFTTVADPIPEQNRIVSPRICFLVKDREVFHRFFNGKGIETASWFDGPLSPLPNSAAFAYDKERYPQSSYISKYIVNLPCHSRLSSADIAHISTQVEAFAKLHGDLLITHKN